jgi:hypothetical protein
MTLNEWMSRGDRIHQVKRRFVVGLVESALIESEGESAKALRGLFT